MCAPRTAPPAPQQPEQGVRVHGRRRAHLRHPLEQSWPLTRNHIPCGGFSCTVRSMKVACCTRCVDSSAKLSATMGRGGARNLLCWLRLLLLPASESMPRQLTASSHPQLPASPPMAMSAELVVAVAAAAPSQEQWAAEQLAHWLGALPGAPSNCTLGRPHCSPPLLDPSAIGGRPAIFVGADAAQAAGFPHSQLHGLGPDAFRCSSDDAPPRLVLTGGLNCTDGAEPRGTINAVFEFLRLAGFRWYGVYTADQFGGFDHTAPGPTATLPSCSDMVRTSPTFRYRSLNNVDTSGTAAAVSYWCESQPHSPRPCGSLVQ